MYCISGNGQIVSCSQQLNHKPYNGNLAKQAEPQKSAETRSVFVYEWTQHAHEHQLYSMLYAADPYAEQGGLQ